MDLAVFDFKIHTEVCKLSLLLNNVVITPKTYDSTSAASQASRLTWSPMINHPIILFIENIPNCQGNPANNAHKIRCFEMMLASTIKDVSMCLV